MIKKDKRMGKQRLPIIDSLVYSELLFQVAAGNNYARKISEDLKGKKEASVILKQLKILEEENFVNSETKEDKTTFPMQRLRIYNIGWKRVNETFIDYLFNKFSKEYKVYKKLDNPSKQFDESFKKTKDKKFEREIKDHEYLQIMLKGIFSHSKKSEQTIKDLFESLKADLTFLQIKLPLEEEGLGINIGERRAISDAIVGGMNKDEKYKQLKDLAKIARGISDLITMRETDNLAKYLQAKYLLSIPEATTTQNFIKNCPERIKNLLIEKNPEFEETIEKISQNGFKGTKPIENKGEGSENANKNVVLSTGKGEIENEK
jgi:predicted transcriptional regulator